MTDQEEIEHYRERVKDESEKLETSYLDPDRIRFLLDRGTPGPWHWVIHDYSTATLQGPAEEWDHVCSVSPCGACRDRAKQADGEWKWGRCVTPTEPNADLMMMAPTLAKKYLEQTEELKQMKKYPIIHDSHLYQYGEDVYVWFDEAGLVGGAANTLEQAKDEQTRYLKNLG